MAALLETLAHGLSGARVWLNVWDGTLVLILGTLPCTLTAIVFSVVVNHLVSTVVWQCHFLSVR